MRSTQVRDSFARGGPDGGPRHGQEFWVRSCGSVQQFCLPKFRAHALMFECAMLARQVAKRKSENYQLFWREDRADFVRLAAKFDAVIVPFAAVGGDDAFDLFLVSASG